MAEKDLKENPFRDEIFEYLLSHGYVESQKTDYDFKNAFDTAKLFEFLEATQPEEMQKLKDTYHESYKDKFVQLLSQKIENRGLVAALNESVEDYSSNINIKIAYFKPNNEAMTEGLANYEKNIFSVRREFTYEDKENPYRVDLALFLNGIPMVMIELKKQTAGQKAAFEGTKQFKTKRDPSNLVFQFNKRALAYFAVDEFTAYVATKLDKQDTRFLPFNMGSEDEGAGNPVTPGKHSTYYLWEDILQKDMLLKIFREFVFIDDGGNLIFPRYHQLRAVLHCESDVKKNGIGGRYLIWHSAGSGKTKTIAWLAKRMINFSNVDTVIVISDRTVIDGQIGAELMNVDGQKGVARHIDNGSKGLASAIESGGYIIVTTLQKFRPVLKEIKKFPKRNYAIIIDEAHSSTAGKSMSKASETLTGQSLKEAVELDNIYEEQEDGQAELAKSAPLMKTTKNVSYFAFTATPKKETMELFGTRREIGKTYFDKYSMKQAIEEGFIVNPLLCYTRYYDNYKVDKKKDDFTEYQTQQAQAAILNYVTSTDEVIETKTQIMMDDFIDKRINWLNGEGKAMIIVPSRKHAVCYRLAIDKYLKKRGASFRACVAFTGTIEIDGVKYTEESMNQSFIESKTTYDIKSIIKNNKDLRVIVVADKLQTGFDENRLCVMYIDKYLGSAPKAVQTISRLNRPAKGKKTFVLDFVNEPEQIKEFFTNYYGGEIYLPTDKETDPNILFAKRDHILDYCVVTLLDANKIFDLIQDREENAGEISSLIASIKRKYDSLEDKKKDLFAAELKKFGKLFYYISAVYNNWNADMEKLAVVFGILYNVLYVPKEFTKFNPEDVVELVDYSTKLVQEELVIDLEAKDQAFEGISTDVAQADPTFSYIDEIIERFNSAFAEASEELNKIVDTLSNDEDLLANVRSSSPSAYEAVIAEKFTDKINENMLDGFMNDNKEKADFYTELSADKSTKDQLINRIIRKIKDKLSVA